MNISMVKQVLELERMTAVELRKVYNNLFSVPCTGTANKEQLIPKLAYKIQELALGGLKESTKAKLDSIAKNSMTGVKNKHCDLLPGTKICKEYDGTIHQVEVLKDGFEYNGQKWKSLSAIATKITGTKWNGPKFFGMRG
ncbi:MAG: DUF2924 domain-containing protein [Rickettsiales bacterium]|jgi:hypothetical protein|nr:DUF2924 domain-containing protein [Rickettsiales bacterium]